jgi:hypothetical protein
MPKNYYIPDREPELALWLQNFSSKIATQGPVLGLTAPQITALQTLCDDLVTSITKAEESKRDAQETTNAKNAQKASTLSSMRLSIKNMKSTVAYTEAIGEDLGIVGNEQPFDPATFKTTLKARTFPGYVNIEFLKGKSDGINIYGRLKGTASWIFLARDTASPYNDTRPLTTPNTPETREYMAIGVLDDQQIGQQSDVVEVTFGG